MGEWSKHGVFGNSFTRVIETNTDVYYLADGWLYSFSKENQETHNLSGEGDLNDVSINNIYYNTDKKYLLVAYANGNIDIIKDGGEVINMPDIYISDLSSSKNINDVSFSKNGAYVATYVPEFDNLLQYSGSSIRIKGVKGIRMITSIDKTVKNALTGKGLAGYTLAEYGTALAWAADLENGLVLGQDYTKSNFAYKKGEADPVFNTTPTQIQYTNVLVGFNDDQCIPDIAMRPYIILEDAEGTQITIYGGIVYRNIGYIAYQNRNVFNPGSSSYDFVWGIIHHVYGDAFDKEYKG